MDTQSLALHLQRLASAQLIVEEAPGQYAFRHTLIHDAAYSTLLLRERKAFHRLIAETLEEAYADMPEAHLADLAYHYYQAETWEKALDYSRRAGEKAQSLFAPREASEQLTRAIEAARMLSLPPPIEVYRQRGQAYETLGDFEQARADFLETLGMARTSGDGMAEWQALIDLGFLWAAKDYERTGEYFREALDLARRLDAPANIAHSLNRVGNWHLNLAQPSEGRRYHLEAQAIFEEQHNPGGLAETLDLLGMASFMSGDAIRGAHYFQQAMDLFRQIGDRRGLSSSLATLAESGVVYLTDAVVIPSHLQGASIPQAELALQIAREIGWRAGEVYARILFGASLGTIGEYGQAFDQLSSALATAADIGHQQWLCFANMMVGCLYLDLLDPATAQQYAEKAVALAQEINSPFMMAASIGLMGGTLVQEGQLDDARETLETVLGQESRYRVITGQFCWAARLELALAEGDAGLALEIADRLVESAVKACSSDGTEGERPAWQNPPRLLLLRGQALAALGRFEESDTVLKLARECSQAHQARRLVWRARLALGQLYAAQGQGEQARQEFAAARSQILELALKVPDASLRSKFLENAARMFPG